MSVNLDLFADPLNFESTEFGRSRVVTRMILYNNTACFKINIKNIIVFDPCQYRITTSRSAFPRIWAVLSRPLPLYPWIMILVGSSGLRLELIIDTCSSPYVIKIKSLRFSRVISRNLVSTVSGD